METWVKNRAGHSVFYPAAVLHMDEAIVDELHSIGYDTPQEFFTAYEKAHEATTGNPWFLSEKNPIW